MPPTFGCDNIIVTPLLSGGFFVSTRRSSLPAAMIASLLAFFATSTGLCSIRGPGKYNGVVIFDRWDGCHLYSGGYIMEISEKVKVVLRPYAGQAVLIDAQEVIQPMNPGDGLITKLVVLGPAAEPATAGFGRPPLVEGLSLKAIPNFGAQGGDELIIEVRNTGETKREIDTGALAPTLLGERNERFECFNASDGPSYPVITRTNINSLNSYPVHGSCGSGRTLNLWLLPGIALSSTFNLDPGQNIEIPLRFTLSAGKYQFLAGYGGGVHQARALASNLLSFDIDEAGRPHLVGAATTDEAARRPRRVAAVCGKVVLEDGSAAANARVFLWPAPIAKAEPRAANMTVSSGEGGFRMESVLEGQYALSAVLVSLNSVLTGASGDGHLSDAKVLSLPSSLRDCSLRLTVRPAPAYTIRGRTQAADPAAGTRVARLIMKSGDAFPFESTAVIQADGRYEFRNVPAGRYQFFAGRTGSGFDVTSDIDDLRIDIRWPDKTSTATGGHAMPADFNEVMTVVELRALDRAEHTYAKTYDKGFARNLDVLGPPPKWYHETEDYAGLVGKIGTPFLADEDATHFTESGYRFAYICGEADAQGKITRYTFFARPTQFGKTGKRNFLMDESGVIHATSADGLATEHDPVVNDYP
jgi:hypothetical protein